VMLSPNQPRKERKPPRSKERSVSLRRSTRVQGRDGFCPTDGTNRQNPDFLGAILLQLEEGSR